MKTTLVALACALASAACASKTPAQDPSSASMQAQPATDTSTTATNSAPSGAPTGPDTGASGATSMMGTGMPAPGTTPAPAADGAGAGAAPVATQTSTNDATSTAAGNRDDRGATPLQQGNSPSELKITAGIRRGVMRAKGFSFAARNVKIITIGSRVTLRGEVKSDDERSTIEAMARGTDGVTDVDNQLTIKAAK